ncbi:hypothetical protein BJF78_13785 [Pseudonocardia sp. CNS-139]|nr:hypothetical protein BJF78_13785 [Pseudonocardia sp. CNS-139]
MPPARSPRTRARDLDRSELCAALDAAYADGQLDGEEHRVRTAAAMAAKTLGELHALASDLQLQQPMPELRERPPVRPRSTVGVVVVVALVLVGAAFGIGRLTAPAPEPAVAGTAPAGGGDVAPVVVGPVALHTPEGLRTFLDAVRTQLGTTRVGDATIYPDYAVVEMPAPGAPARAQSYYYKGGFDDPTSAGGRDPDEPLVDLALIDVTAILGLFAGAPETLHVEDPTSRYILVRDTGGGPQVSIYMTNSDYGESGYLSARPDGTVISVHPYEAG